MLAFVIGTSMCSKVIRLNNLRRPLHGLLSAYLMRVRREIYNKVKQAMNKYTFIIW